MTPLLFSIVLFAVYFFLLSGIYAAYMLIELRKDKQSERKKDK